MTNGNKHRTYDFGVNSIFVERIYNHQFFAFMFVFFFSVLVMYSINKDEGEVERCFIGVLPIFVLLYLLFRFIHRNSAYRINIDFDNKQICFHMMFGRGKLYANIDDVKIIIRRKINFHFNGKRVEFFNECLEGILPVIKGCIEFKFVGFWAKLWEKELIKRKVA